MFTKSFLAQLLNRYHHPIAYAFQRTDKPDLRNTSPPDDPSGDGDGLRGN